MVILFWLAFSCLVGYLATERGRSFFAWFLLAAALSPIIGIIAILIAGEKK